MWHVKGRRGRGRWAVVVLAVVLAACTADTEPPAPPAPESDGGGLSWRRSEAPSLRSDRLGATLGQVLAEPGGDWLVAGTVFDPDRPPAPTLWRSGDGAGWEAETLPAEAGARLLAAAASGDTVVVAGQAGDDREGIALAYAATSGGPFEAVDDESLTLPGVSLDILAGGEGGFVAAGDRRGGDGGDIAVLTSEDGRRWQVAAGAEALVNEASAPGIGGAAVAPGGIVLVGSTDGDAARTGAVWRAGSEGAWERVATFAGGDDIAVNGVSADGDGFVAVGHEVVDGLREPRVWRSPDGRQWQSSPSEFEVSGDIVDSFGVTVRRLVRQGEGWAAVGTTPGGERLWRSTDLRRWREVPLPEGPGDVDAPTLSLLGASRDTVLAGSASTGTPLLVRAHDGEVSNVTATDAAFPDPRTDLGIYGVFTTDRGPILIGDIVTRQRAVSGRQVRAQLWHQDPSGEWSRIDGAGVFDQAEVTDVVQLDDQLVAIGNEAVVDELFSQGNPVGLVWTSADGESWSEVTGPGTDALAGGSTTTVQAAVGTPDGLAAVGTVLNTDARRQEAAFWTASGPGSWTRGAATGTLPPDVRDTQVFDVCLVDDTLVAVGSGIVPAGARGLVWTSQGGETWEAAAPDSMAGQGPWQLLGCETTSDGVVVVGGRGSADAEKGEAGVWTSPDGRTWTSVESPSFAGDGGFRLLRDVAVAGPQRFAVGQYREDGRTHQALWWSREGGQWELLALPGDLFEGAESESVQDVAVVDGEVVLVGWVDADAAVWRAPLPD